MIFVIPATCLFDNILILSWENRCRSGEYGARREHEKGLERDKGAPVPSRPPTFLRTRGWTEKRPNAGSLRCLRSKIISKSHRQKLRWIFSEAWPGGEFSCLFRSTNSYSRRSITNAKDKLKLNLLGVVHRALRSAGFCTWTCFLTDP